MSFKKYKQNPIELLQPKNMEARSLYVLDIKWDCYPPNNPSRAHKLYVKVKPHVDYMLHLFAVLSTDELWKLQLYHKDGLIPDMFRPFINQFYESKQKDSFITKFVVKSYILFDYESKSSFIVPSKPTHKQMSLIAKVPEIHPNIPVATREQIQRLGL